MALEVFRVFLRLGLTSFGGPVAHLGYFRNEFVERRGWLDERSYAELVALCQFLPGPASSQVGFAIGLRRAGWPGAIAAWLGFTLPSAVLLVLFARGLAWAGEGNEWLASLVQSLKIVAVAVVAQAVWMMSRALCPDAARRALAVVTALGVLLASGVAAQVVALAVCAAIGARLFAGVPTVASAAHDTGVGARAGWAALVLFVVLLVGLPLIVAAVDVEWLAVFDAFYRAGALVFGGGHVVLPLLQAGVVEPGWVSESAFVAGYGAAQAVPGPLFTFAAYLGSLIGNGLDGAARAGSPESLAAWRGAGLCLVAVFLPGLLLVVAALPLWQRVRRHERLRGAISAVNAGVVGVLLAALIDPVARSAIRNVPDALVALLCLALLTRWRWPALAVVAVAAATGLLRALS